MNCYNTKELTINSIETQKVFIVYSEGTTPQLEIFQLKMMLKLSGTKFGANIKNLMTMRCG